LQKKIDSRFVDAWINKGSALICLGKYQDALNALDNATMLNPQSEAAWGNRGTVLFFFLGRTEDALYSFLNATKINPLESDIWLNIWGYIRSVRRI
jgi:tetratricopeptide (TPR) repeat protein